MLAVSWYTNDINLSNIIVNGVSSVFQIRFPNPLHMTELINIQFEPLLIIVFSSLQRSRIQVWLYEQINMRIEGCIIVSDSSSGFIFSVKNTWCYTPLMELAYIATNFQASFLLALTLYKMSLTMG